MIYKNFTIQQIFQDSTALAYDNDLQEYFLVQIDEEQNITKIIAKYD
jgi:hypothetical protein